MPICSYLVVPEPGAGERVRRRLSVIDGCEVTVAENRELLILITDTSDLEQEEELRAEVEGMDGIQALLFTFGEIDPETELADPVQGVKRRRASAGASSPATRSREEGP